MNKLVLLTVLLVTYPGFSQTDDVTKALRERLKKEDTKYVERDDWEKQFKRIPFPKRITFGPEDAFQSYSFEKSDWIFFTRKIGLNTEMVLMNSKDSSKLMILNRGSNLSEIQISPDGRKVSYLSRGAGGASDLCWRDLLIANFSKDELVAFDNSKNDQKGADRVFENLLGKESCLINSKGFIRHPFWIGSTKLGFLYHSDQKESRTLRETDLVTGDAEKVKMIKEVDLAALSSSGRGVILGLEKNNQGDKITLIKTGSGDKGDQNGVCKNALKLPISIGQLKISNDGNTFLLSGFLGDTNKDGKIDFNDRSVVARGQVSSICDKNPIEIEVITTLETDCRFPEIAEQLSLTCSFEGSLDIYELPRDGQKLLNWSAEDYNKALDFARSPYEKIFYLLNGKGIKGLGFRVWSQFLIAGDDVGALKWLPLAKESEKWIAETESFWRTFFEAGILRKKYLPQGIGELSLARQEELRSILKNFKSNSGRGTNSAKGSDIGKGTDSGKSLYPLLKMKVALNLVDKKLFQEGLAELLKVSPKNYLEVLVSSVLLDEGKALAFESSEEKYFQYLLRYFNHNEIDSLPLFVRSLERMNFEKENSVSSLMESVKPESQVYHLLQFEKSIIEVNKGKKSAFNEFDEYFLKLRQKKEYTMLLRVVGLRAMRVWNKRDDFDKVHNITSRLLNLFEKSSYEWTSIFDFYIEMSFDRGYEREQQDNYGVALGHFFGAIAMSDRLEAHWGFVRNTVESGGFGRLNLQLDDMLNRKMSRADRISVDRALSSFQQKNSKWSKERPTLKDYQIVIEELHKFDGKTDPYIKFLLGSFRLSKLILDPWLGNELQEADYNQTQKELVLALDLSYDDIRQKVSCLENLIILNIHAKKWHHVLGFSEMRMRLPFSENELKAGKKTVLQFYLSHGFFYDGQFVRAYELLKDIHDEDIPKMWFIPLKFRLGTYANLANEFQVAKESFDRVILHESFDRLDDHLRSMAFSQRGWARLGGQKPQQVKGVVMEQSRSDWISAWKILVQNKNIADIVAEDQSVDESSFFKMFRMKAPTGGTRLRKLILLTGFMSKYSIATEEKNKWLLLRIQLLEGIRNKNMAHGFTTLSYLEQILKTRMEMINAFGIMSGRRAEVDKFLKIEDLLSDLEKYRLELGSTTSRVWFEVLNGVYIFNKLGVTKLSPKEMILVNEKYSSFIDVAQKTSFPSPHLLSYIVRLKTSRDLGDIENLKIEKLTQKKSELLKSKEYVQLENSDSIMAKISKDWIMAVYQ